MSFQIYPCPVCARDVNVYQTREVGYCQYCGTRVVLTEMMKKHFGKTDLQILSELESFEELVDIFTERTKLNSKQAIEFLKLLPQVQDRPSWMIVIADLFADSDVSTEITFLNAAANSKHADDEGFTNANRRLLDAYEKGDEHLGIRPDANMAKQYRWNLTRSPSDAGKAFYWFYLHEPDALMRDDFLRQAANNGHKKAMEILEIERIKKAPLPQCIYFNHGICGKKTGYITMHCAYKERGESQGICPDYRSS